MSFQTLLRARAVLDAAQARRDAGVGAAAESAVSRFRSAIKGPEPFDHVQGSAASRLLALRAKADPATYSEIKRICKLAVRDDLTPEEVEWFNRENVLASAYEDISMGTAPPPGEPAVGFRLSPKQCQAVMEFDALGGVLCPMGVGSGKTLVTQMIAERVYRAQEPLRSGRGRRRITLLVVTPSTYVQFMETNIPWARRRISLTTPFFGLGGMSSANRLAYARSRRKGCYVIPNSLLSVKDTSAMLADLDPDCVILDEAHNCANASAARTRRLVAAMDISSPEGADWCPQFVALSGTITKKSIRDYHKFLRWALHDKMPLPVSKQLASDWAAVLDAGSDGMTNVTNTGPIKPIVSWARTHFPETDFGTGMETEDLRAAYQKRLSSSPGVVSSGDSAIGTSLIIENVPIKGYEDRPGFERLKCLLDDIENAWLTPNGDEIECAIHTWKWLYELTAGFYNELTWPTSEQVAERRQIGATEAETAVKRALEHHAAHEVYAKALRTWLGDHQIAGCDTPFLVGQEMHRNADTVVGPHLYGLWRAAKDLQTPDMVERESRAVRVCDFRVRGTVDWVKDLLKGGGRGAILWCYHKELARWLRDELLAEGIDPLYCPAGENDRISAVGDPDRGGKGDRIVVASIRGHGEGKNLQAFEHNRVVQWPRAAHVSEQLLGRTHRRGQMADELHVSTGHTLDFDFMLFAACVSDALYVHATTGNQQKLVYATYNPLPKMFPSNVLRARGLDPQAHGAKMDSLISEKFSTGTTSRA